MRAKTRTTTAVAAVLITGGRVTATAGPAAAAPAGPGASPRFVVAANGRVAPADDQTSPVAGYAADLSGFASLKRWTATETFTVPAVRCTARTTNVLFVSLYLQGTDKAGDTLDDEAYVLVSCQGTTPTYQLYSHAAGGDSNGQFAATAAGDTVRIDLAATAKTETSTITDVTTGASASQTGSGFTANYLQASVQGGDGHSVFPKFGKVHFSKVVAVGQSLQALEPFQFNATDAAGTVKIQTSPIDASRKGFVTTFVANYSPPA